MGTAEGRPTPQCAKKSKQSGKEASTDVPSWARGKKPREGESGRDFAKRLLDEQYGPGEWKGTGSGPEFSKLQQFGDPKEY